MEFLNLKVAAAVFALLLSGCDGWKHHLSSDGTSLASKFDPSKRTLKIEATTSRSCCFSIPAAEFRNSEIIKFIQNSTIWNFDKIP
ncbi:MAG: hypothetical protein ACFNVQ_04395 [Campylobacter sp.]